MDIEDSTRLGFASNSFYFSFHFSRTDTHAFLSLQCRPSRLRLPHHWLLRLSLPHLSLHLFGGPVESFLRRHPAYDILTPLPAPSTAALVASDSIAFRVLDFNVVLFASSAPAPSRFRGENGRAVLLEALNESIEILSGESRSGRGERRSGWR